MSQDEKNYDAVVAVHGFNPLAPQDPDTKDFKPVAQDRLREAYKTVEDIDQGKDVLMVLTGGSYKDRLNNYMEDEGHNQVEKELPSEARLMQNQLDWMYDGREDGRLPAEETGWKNEHGEYEGNLDKLNADIILEGDSQNTEENAQQLANIVEEANPDALYTISSRDHWQRAGTETQENIRFEDEVDWNGRVYSAGGELSYVAPKANSDGEITELNPGVFFGESAKLRPVIDALDEKIWPLLGESRDKIDGKAEDIRYILNE